MLKSEEIKIKLSYLFRYTINNIKTYVIHYSKLNERKESLKKILIHENINNNVQWIDYPNREELVTNITKKNEYYHSEKNTWKKKYEIINKSGFYPPYENVLSDGIIANGISHILTWTSILHSDHDFALILEDDVILINNFLDLLYEYMIQLPPSWDILFIGNEFNDKKPYQRGKNIYTKQYSRTTDGYIIRKKTIQKIISDIVPFTLPIDHELGYWIIKLKLNVYHAFPGLIKQGSIHQNFKSSLRQFLYLN